MRSLSVGVPVTQKGKPGLIVAIDGPAGAGKSTVAKLLATRLGFLYLDTGALYRAVAWKVRQRGLNPEDRAAVSALLPETRIEMTSTDGAMRVLVDGRDVTGELRTPDITSCASVVSVIPAVREWLLPIQRSIGAAGAVVAEGRDIGTKVFPSADVKFFLEADAEIRAVRRHQELVAAGRPVALETTRQDLSSRDRRDRSRDIAPLVAAPDSQHIDTSTMPPDQVVDHMMAVIAARL